MAGNSAGCGGPGQGNLFSLMSNRPTLVSFPPRLPGAWVRPLDDETSPLRAERQRKQNVRQAHEVVTVLDLFWATALGVPLGAESEDATLGRAEYIDMRHKLYRALYAIYDSIDAQVTAEEEWMRDTDSPDAEEIGKTRFQQPLFEMACGWTMGLWDARMLAAFLWDLFGRVASGSPPTVCKWRADEDIQFAGWRLGEHTGSWGRVRESSIDRALRAIAENPERSVATSAVPSPAQLRRGTTGGVAAGGDRTSASPSSGHATGSRLGAAAWKRMAGSPRR